MKQIIFIFLFILLFITGVPNCTKYKCDCKDAPPYYDIQGFTTQNYKIIGIDKERFIYEKLLSTDSVNATKFALNIQAIVNYYGQIDPPILLPDNLFINRTFACSCAGPGYLGTDEEIQNVIIKSNANFKPGYLAGDTLNIFFDITFYGKIQSSLNQYLSSNPQQAPEGFGLVLNQNPTLSLEHTFTIHYYQTNGEFYLFSSEPVKFY
ncbi:MAG: hypothetical protein FVQ77_04410 [Cytophagales bacterium]|nr:hypothetical protein [Cytophagales bacterium]